MKWKIIGLLISLSICFGVDEKEIALMIISAEKALEKRNLTKHQHMTLEQGRNVLCNYLSHDKVDNARSVFECPEIQDDEVNMIMTRICVLQINVQRDEIERAISVSSEKDALAARESNALIRKLCLCGLCEKQED